MEGGGDKISKKGRGRKIGEPRVFEKVGEGNSPRRTLCYQV